MDKSKRLSHNFAADGAVSISCSSEIEDGVREKVLEFFKMDVQEPSALPSYSRNSPPTVRNRLEVDVEESRHSSPVSGSQTFKHLAAYIQIHQNLTHKY